MSFALVGEMLKISVFAGLSVAGFLAIGMLMRNRSRKISTIRIFVHAASQVGIFMIIAYPLWLSLVLFSILFMTLFAGRFYCGWICPFGFYMDLTSFLRQALKKRHLRLPENVNRKLHRLRYVLLGTLLAAPLWLINFNPITWSSAKFLSGPLNPLRILLAPLVPVIAPWKTLYESNLNFPYVDQIAYYSSEEYVLFSVIAFVAFALVSSFIVRRFWCRFCPTGSSLAVANKLRLFGWVPALHLEKDEEKCTKCGICKRVCPVQVTEVYEQKGGRIDTSMCLLCLRCVEMCPYEGCLKAKIVGRTIAESRNWLEPSSGKEFI